MSNVSNLQQCSKTRAGYWLHLSLCPELSSASADTKFRQLSSFQCWFVCLTSPFDLLSLLTRAQIYSQPPHNATYTTDEERMNAFFESLGMTPAASGDGEEEDPYTEWWGLDIPAKVVNNTALSLIHEHPEPPPDTPPQVGTRRAAAPFDALTSVKLNAVQA